MQQIQQRLIQGQTQNTEYNITNNTDRSFIMLIQMQGGSGDINKIDSGRVGVDSGVNQKYYDYLTGAGKNGNFINLNHNGKNYSVLGGSGNISSLKYIRAYANYYYTNAWDNGWHIYKWENLRDDWQVATEGQKKHVVIFFKRGESLRINFTSFGSSAEQKGFILLTLLV